MRLNDTHLAGLLGVAGGDSIYTYATSSVFPI